MQLEPRNSSLRGAVAIRGVDDVGSGSARLSRRNSARAGCRWPGCRRPWPPPGTRTRAAAGEERRPPPAAASDPARRASAAAGCRTRPPAGAAPEPSHQTTMASDKDQGRRTRALFPVLVGLEALARHQRIAPRELQILLDHLRDQRRRKSVSRLPAQLVRALVASPSRVSTSVGRK